MLLEFVSVRKIFQDNSGRFAVLKDINFKLKAGETLALTGESGSGKSTLLHIAAGLEDVSNGHVKICGTDIGGLNDKARADLRRRDIALIFQHYNLIPSLNVAANISFHAKLSGQVDNLHINHLTQALGLSDLITRYPEALSGGQQQRVAIARALAMKPRLLLADEPTGNLDEITAIKVLDQMLELVSHSGASLLTVTHSSKVAARMDQKIHLQNGRLVCL
jgi:putative ABC transport system ATP-binding protein